MVYTIARLLFVLVMVTVTTAITYADITIGTNAGVSLSKTTWSAVSGPLSISYANDYVMVGRANTNGAGDVHVYVILYYLYHLLDINARVSKMLIVTAHGRGCHLYQHRGSVCTLNSAQPSM